MLDDWESWTGKNRRQSNYWSVKKSLWGRGNIYFLWILITCIFILCQYLWRTKNKGIKWSFIKYSHLSNNLSNNSLVQTCTAVKDWDFFWKMEQMNSLLLWATPLNCFWEFNYSMMTLSKDCIKSLKIFSYLGFSFLLASYRELHPQIYFY